MSILLNVFIILLRVIVYYKFYKITTKTQQYFVIIV